MSESRKYYDQLADVYDIATGQEGAWTPPLYIYERLKYIINTDCNILDIGIGTGKSIDLIYHSDKYSSITGVDVSEKMLSKCREKYPNIDLINISSINDLDKIDDQFDLIICSGTFEFIENIKVFFEQCKRLIKKKGILCFTYEPIIDFHPIQQYSKKNTVGDTKAGLFVKGFYTYRYRPFKIIKLLSAFNFKLKSDEEFISYKKFNEKIIYHLIVSEG